MRVETAGRIRGWRTIVLVAALAGCGGKARLQDSPSDGTAKDQAATGSSPGEPAPGNGHDAGGPTAAAPDARHPGTEAIPGRGAPSPVASELERHLVELSADDESMRASAVEYFESRRDVDREVVRQLAENAPIEVRRGAVHWLLMRFDSLDSSQVDFFIRLLADGDAVIRHVAVQAARQFENYHLKSALPNLIRLLSAERETAEYRAIVVQLLQKLRLDGAPALDELSRCLREDPEADVRMACVYAIVRIAHPEQASQLLRPALVADESPEVRRLAAVRLGRLDIFSDQTMRDLVMAFDDDDEGVRDAAATALVAFGPPAVGPLTAALGSDSVRTRLMALVALGRAGGAAAGAVPAVEKCLADQDPQVRELAESVLRAIKGS